MLLTAQIYPYVILGNVLLIVLSTAISLLVLYGVVRLAVTHSLRRHEDWLDKRSIDSQS